MGRASRVTVPEALCLGLYLHKFTIYLKPHCPKAPAPVPEHQQFLPLSFQTSGPQPRVMLPLRDIWQCPGLVLPMAWRQEGALVCNW